MPPALRLTTGLLATVVLGVGAVHLGLPGPSHREISSSLQRDVRAALTEAGYGWADVRMEGQRAVLLGTAPGEQALRDARRVAIRAVSVGGPVAGGVTSVDIRQADIMPSSHERASLEGSVAR